MATTINTNLCLKLNEIIQAVNQENWQYFLDANEQHALEQTDINWAFGHACAIGSDTVFIDHILSLHVDNAYIKRGCVEAFQNKHYATVLHVLKKLGKDLKINLLEQVAINSFQQQQHFANLLAQEHTQELGALMLTLAPNHTQRMRHKVKYYDEKDYLTYAVAYNKFLGHLIWCASLNSSADERESIFKGIEILSAKKFPVYAKHVRPIQMMKLEHLFVRRLSNTKPRGFFADNDYHDLATIGASQILFKEEDAKNSIMVGHKKLDLSYQLCQFFKAPQEVTDQVNRFFGKREHFVKKLPNNIEAQFLQKLEHEASPRIFAYFCRYYLYERWKLYQNLHATLLNNPESYRLNHTMDTVKI